MPIPLSRDRAAAGQSRPLDVASPARIVVPNDLRHLPSGLVRGRHQHQVPDARPRLGQQRLRQRPRQHLWCVPAVGACQNILSEPLAFVFPSLAHRRTRHRIPKGSEPCIRADEATAKSRARAGNNSVRITLSVRMRLRAVGMIRHPLCPQQLHHSRLARGGGDVVRRPRAQRDVFVAAVRGAEPRLAGCQLLRLAARQCPLLETFARI